MALVSTLYQMTRKGMLLGGLFLSRSSLPGLWGKSPSAAWTQQSHLRDQMWRLCGCDICHCGRQDCLEWLCLLWWEWGLSSSTAPCSPKEETHSFSEVYRGYRGLALIFHYCFPTTLWLSAHGLLMASLVRAVPASGKINAPVPHERRGGWKAGG